MDYEPQFKKILETTINQEASDLLISVGPPPVIRVVGQLIPLVNEKKVTAEISKGFAFSLLGEERKEKFLREKEIDFSYDFGGKARFRVNIFFQKDTISLALRLISPSIRTIENLKLEIENSIAAAMAWVPPL